MIIFASLEGPPIDFIELGIKTTQDVSREGIQMTGMPAIEPLNFLKSTLPNAFMIMSIVAITVQIVRMKDFGIKSRKTVYG